VGTCEDIRLAALLHDALEDTRITRHDLAAMGYSDRTLDIVELLTKRDRRPYPEYIASLRGNMDAVAVKIADLEDNLDPERLARLTPEKRARFVAKYTGPLVALRLWIGGDDKRV
jgi:(p)ppGpp synthase/HD superfamily hydrolase